jgi:hypothetical protein
LTLPRLLPAAGFWWFALLTVLGTLIPVVVVLCVSRVPGPGQTTSGRALWWHGPSTLACTSAEWAAQLAKGGDGSEKKRRQREPFPWALFSAPVLSFAVAPMLFSFQHPEMVVLNLGEAPFLVVVEGQTLARVPVTSLESRTAGVHLRLAAGRRQVELLSEQGQVLLRSELVLEAGRTHLYAPLSADHCFWLERDAYGQAPAPQARYRALPDETRFWTLPRDVDTWFAKNPDASSDHRSSGGTLLALRHARCAEAPEGVQ